MCLGMLRLLIAWSAVTCGNTESGVIFEVVEEKYSESINCIFFARVLCSAYALILRGAGPISDDHI